MLNFQSVIRINPELFINIIVFKRSKSIKKKILFRLLTSFWIEIEFFLTSSFRDSRRFRDVQQGKEYNGCCIRSMRWSWVSHTCSMNFCNVALGIEKQRGATIRSSGRPKKNISRLDEERLVKAVCSHCTACRIRAPPLRRLQNSEQWIVTSRDCTCSCKCMCTRTIPWIANVSRTLFRSFWTGRTSV